MSDDSPALATTPSPSPQDDGEYEAIHAALMETARGRAFLAEYARRNRRADIAALLAASERIEATMREQHAAEPAAPAPPSGDSTSDVSTEAGQAPEHVLDQRVPAFSWLDMPRREATPQAAPPPAAEPASETPVASAASSKIVTADEFADLLFEPGMPATPARAPRTESKPDTPPLDAVPAERAETPAAAAKPTNGGAVAAKPIRQPAMPAPQAGDPLAPLKAMSDEEKIALFS
jgi:hypothetical protein